MADLNFHGIVQKVFPMVTVGTNGFNKRDIVVRSAEQYPQDVVFQFTQDKCDLLDMYPPGSAVIISFNLRGQLDGWTNPQGEVKYFNTVQGWKIARDTSVAGAAPQQQAPPVQQAAPVRQFVFTATDGTIEQYRAGGWSEEMMVQHGKGYWAQAAPPLAPAPVQAPPVQQYQQAPPANQYAPQPNDLPFE